MSTSTDPFAVQSDARAAALIKVRQDWITIISLGDKLGSDKIRFVNLGREVGLALQGLCEHEQMRLSFFEHLKEELPDTLTFNAVQKCIHLAHFLPEAVTTLEQANQAEGQMLLAGGWLEMPRRTEQQISRSVTPDVFVFRAIADAKGKLFKRLEDVADWDPETRASIRKQVEDFEKVLAELKARL